MTETKLQRDIRLAVEALNSIPWWHPLMRQDAAREYRRALLAGALAEIKVVDGICEGPTHYACTHLMDEDRW